jgi:site-specific recombinase XerC
MGRTTRKYRPQIHGVGTCQPRDPLQLCDGAAPVALANAGHDTRALQAWLGHKNIQHTVRYTELAPDRFKNFWR